MKVGTWICEELGWPLSAVLSTPVLCTGDYQVSIKFNDQPIPDSPFDVYVAPSGADITRLDVTDLDKEVLQVFVRSFVRSFFAGRNPACVAWWLSGRALDLRFTDR